MSTRPALSALFLLLSLLPVSVRAGLSLVEEGSEIRQMVSDESYLYLLEEGGRLLRRRLRGGPLETLDEASAGRTMAATRGILYLLTEGGAVAQYRGSQKRTLETRPGARALAAGNGRMYLLGEGDQIWCFDGLSYQASEYPNPEGIRTLAVSGNSLWMLTQSGEVYQRRGALLEQIAQEIQPVVELSVGSGVCFLRSASGHLWKYQHGQLVQLPQGMGARQLALGDQALFVLGADDEVWSYQDFFGSWTRIEIADNLRAIHATSEALYVSQEDGRLWSWTPHGESGNSLRQRNFQALYAAD